MLPSTTTAESLVPHLKKCGYDDAHIQRSFRVDEVAIPVAAFAGRPFYSWSACIAAVDLNGDSRASAAKVRMLGASTVFVCGPQGVDWWAMGSNGPTSSRPIPWSNVGDVFRKHKDDLAPSRIYNAKLRRPDGPMRQLWFFDVGLMPAIEKTRGETLLRLVDRGIEELHEQLGEKLATRQAQEDVYRTVFWLLAAKVLHDKRVANFIQIDLTNVDEVFDRIGKHHGETNRFPPFGKAGRGAIDEVAATIARCGSLADVSSESIAYVYENALIDKAAGRKKTKKGEKPYDIRKELGIHSTPSVLIHYMLSQMWGMIEEIKPEDRNVFEPACGHAPFLTGAMRWLRDWKRGGPSTTTHDYLRSHLHGVEADDFAIELAKLALTLADEPYGNSWQLTKSDMFLPGVLAKNARKSPILLSNPPYEAFTSAQRARYAKEGEAVTANTKATEMLLRTLPHLPPGGVFGVVVPQGFLHDKESKPVREKLLADFDLSEIDIFADNLFEHGDHEVAVLMGRRKKPRTKPVALNYRRVRECGMEAFKERLAFSSAREVLQSRFEQSNDFDFWVPELDELWVYLSREPKLGEVATVGQGLSHLGKELPVGAWTIHYRPDEDDCLGVASVSNNLAICGMPPLVGINLNRDVLLRTRFGMPTGKPQVLVNYAPVARAPWKLKAALDAGGVALTSRFLAVRPKREGPSALVFWAVINSPIANAFSYCYLGKRALLSGTMRKMPFPSQWQARASSIEQAALRYRQLTTSDGPLFDASATPNAIRDALLTMDAAVLRAYDLPPRLERQLLDLFTNVERKGVGCDFQGYYPAGFTSYLPLHMIISDQFQRASANATADRFKPSDSAYVRDALIAAAGARGE